MSGVSHWHDNMFVVGAPAAGVIWEQASAAISAALELPQRASYEQRCAPVRLRRGPPAGRARRSSMFRSNICRRWETRTQLRPTDATIEVLEAHEIRPL